MKTVLTRIWGRLVSAERHSHEEVLGMERESRVASVCA
jgi:hypothetical protein